MVISLDNEISLYKPYGRKIINWIPSFKNRGKSSKKKEFDVKDGSHSKIYFNDFIAAELDTSRDLFRSTNDVSMSIENTFAMVILFCFLETFLTAFVYRRISGGFAKATKAKKNCM